MLTTWNIVFRILISFNFQSLWGLCWLVMENYLNQDEGVDDQEEQSSKPDPQEGVVAFKLQEVGRAQPQTLTVGRKHTFLYNSQFWLIQSKILKRKL